MVLHGLYDFALLTVSGSARHLGRPAEARTGRSSSCRFSWPVSWSDRSSGPSAPYADFVLTISRKETRSNRQTARPKMAIGSILKTVQTNGPETLVARWKRLQHPAVDLLDDEHLAHLDDPGGLHPLSQIG